MLKPVTRLEKSQLGSTDPLRHALSSQPNYGIISTDHIKMTKSVRKHIERLRPKTWELEVQHPDHLAIIIPYRDRPQHLDQFIPHMQNHLEKQAVKATFYLVEQPHQQPFNRGLLCNIGIHAALQRSHDFICIHDVDLCPIDVSYHRLPQQPYRPFSKLKRQDNHYQSICPNNTFKERCFGGITCLPAKQLIQIHGYSHDYWGWGCEDDDLLIRCLIHGLVPILDKHALIENMPHPPLDHNQPPWHAQWQQVLIRRNRKQLRRFKRNLKMHDNDLRILDHNDYTTMQTQEHFFHIQAHTQRFWQNNPLLKTIDALLRHA